jgi:hypothetical protein
MAGEFKTFVCCYCNKTIEVPPDKKPDYSFDSRCCDACFAEWWHRLPNGYPKEYGRQNTPSKQRRPRG